VLKADAASTAADATGKSVVVVSSTVTSGNVGGKFKSVAVPVLLWNPHCSMMVGLSAPERRVGVSLENTTASVLNAPGRELVDAAIRWAAHVTEESVRPGAIQAGNGSGSQTCTASDSDTSTYNQPATPAAPRRFDRVELTHTRHFFR